MWTNIFVDSLVETHSIVDVIRRRIGIKGKYGIRVFPCVLKNILRDHCQFSQLLVSFVKGINQRRFFPELNANVSGNLEGGASQRVCGDNIPFVEPKPDSGIELTLNRVLARYLKHSLSMPLIRFVLFAVVLPL